MKFSTWIKLNLSFYNQLDRFKNWLVYTFDNPYQLNWPNGYCPVQCEGTLDGNLYYYFRARGSSWRIEIYANEGDYYIGNEKRLFTYTEKFGETFGAGWMSKREAIRFATQGIHRYYWQCK